MLYHKISRYISRVKSPWHDWSQWKHHDITSFPCHIPSGRMIIIHNKSLIWNKAILGWFPSNKPWFQWGRTGFGRYNLPRSHEITHFTNFITIFPWNHHFTQHFITVFCFYHHAFFLLAPLSASGWHPWALPGIQRNHQGLGIQWENRRDNTGDILGI